MASPPTQIFKPEITHEIPMSKPSLRCGYHVQHEPEVDLFSPSATTLSRSPSFLTEIASELVSHFLSGLLLVYSPWKNERDLLTPKLDHDCSRHCLPIYPHPSPAQFTILTMAYHCFHDEVQTLPVPEIPVWISYTPLQFSLSTCGPCPTTLVPYCPLSVSWTF